MPSECSDRPEISKGGHNEIRSVYREAFADHGISHYYAKRVWYRFLEKSDDYTEFSMLDALDRVTGCRSNPPASEGAVSTCFGMQKEAI